MQALAGVLRLLLCSLYSLCLLLAGCDQADRAALPEGPSRVSVWEVTGPHGEQAWIFGTVHALPEGLQWRRPALDRALAQSDQLVMEIGGALDAGEVAQVLGQLGQTPGLPPPADRVSPEKRATVANAFDKLDLEQSRYASTESWSVALQLAGAASAKAGASKEQGVEQALRTMAHTMAGSRPVTGLETIEGQFRLFDALPLPQQTRLLEQTATEIGSERDEERDLVRLWLAGDDNALAREISSGLLADPELRRILLTDRNVQWLGQIERMTARGAKPFVAVGAAHVAGPDGLPAMFARKGWKVRRLP